MTTLPETDGDASSTPRAPRRDGFALPLAIVVLMLLTMGLVAGFAVASSEASVTMSQRAQARAYTYAQQGLEAFLVRRKENTGSTFCPHCWAVNATRPPGGSQIAPTLDTLPTQRETVYVTLSSTGAAIVRATPVWLDIPNGKGTFWITSTGIDLQNSLGGGAGRTSQARRTVGVFVTWNKTTLNVLGAWTSLTGIRKAGTGRIDGNDQCGSGTNVAGLSVPQYGGVADLVVTQNGWNPTGSPPYDTTKTFAQESSAVKIDWPSVKNESALQPDIVIPGGTFPNAGTFAADTNYWPIIHVRNGPGSGLANPWALPNQGRGMLIVDEGLDINGSRQWYGVILVGGVLTSNGNNVSEGATYSGLNALCKTDANCNPTGATPSASSADDAQANGQKSYLYDSCSVSRATSAMARYTMMPNTWMDDIPGW